MEQSKKENTKEAEEFFSLEEKVFFDDDGQKCNNKRTFNTN